MRNTDYLVSNHYTNELDSCYNVLKYSEDNLPERTEWKNQAKQFFDDEYYVGNQLTAPNSKALIYAHTLRGGQYKQATFFVLNINGEHAVAFNEGNFIEIPQSVMDDKG